MATITAPPPLRDALATLLAAVRAKTLRLIAPLSEDDLRRQHDPLMSPILWDLGHMAAFEELWLFRRLVERVGWGEMPGMFNPFEHPRASRGALALPSLEATLERLASVRERVLELLACVELDGGDPLLAGGYVYRMVAQHECQHQETILQTLQLKQGEPYAAPRERTFAPAIRPAPEGAMAYFTGGEVELGTDDRLAAYDNERPRHRALLAPFWIDVAPVSNGAYLAFVDAGGYARQEFWSEAGWAWLGEAGVRAPKYWEEAGGGWWVRTMDRRDPLDPERPVCHVCWHEAEAYARFVGKRLPSESEWEAAASWDPVAGVKRRFPWGEDEVSAEHANLDQLAFEPAPIGAYPENRSPIGCYGMIGDVWEWTSSEFAPYPGFSAFPYAEYSAPFFGTEYRVLRGGSWATAPRVARTTFRNWDYPIRRQIFSGFRCARDG
jgi:iron(II)-dependent oxidoreductase